MARWSAPELARRIEHTLLRPETSEADVARLIDEARTYGFRGICVPPAHVPYARRLLGEGAPIRLVSVVGFPTGYHLTEAKAAEAEALIRAGADELDMVFNNAAFRSGRLDGAAEDVAAVVEVCRRWDVVCKVIIETGLLGTPDNIRTAARIAVKAGADYVKTSTGFFGRGATVEDVRIIREVIPRNVKVKASGGIRTAEQAIALLEAGADVLGASAGVAIVDALQSVGG